MKEISVLRMYTRKKIPQISRIIISRIKEKQSWNKFSELKMFSLPRARQDSCKRLANDHDRN